jgi:hypothetical protein
MMMRFMPKGRLEILTLEPERYAGEPGVQKMIKTMKQSRTCIIAAAFVGLILTACSSPVHEQSLLQKNWGRSYEAQLQLQKANPDAGKRMDPIIGMDGESVDYVLDAYRQSFHSGKQKDTVNIIKLR